MNQYLRFILLFKISLLSLSLLGISATAQAEWSGNIAVQNRYFFNEPLTLNTQQHNNYISLSAEPEFYSAWNNEQQSFTFTPFMRIDQHDSKRTHGDLRELSYQQVFDDWELRVGVSKVYWGVTESQHLVDIINQTDSVENVDGEDKLGQPMIKATFEKDWGTLDFFILPYFRERTFQDTEGRPRTLLVVDTEQTTYESSDKENNIDYSARWFNYFGDLELGLAYFNGTSREAVFTQGLRNGVAVLTPYYPLMQQISIDAQLTTEELLYKLEAVSRDWQNFDNNSLQFIDEQYYALTTGVEYTFVGIIETDADLGVVMEYLYDDRDQNATSFFQNDIMMGLRLAVNDADSTEALLGIIFDLDNQENLLSLEASRRFAQSWTATLEVRLFNNIDPSSLATSIEQDDFVQLDIAYYF